MTGSSGDTFLGRLDRGLDWLLDRSCSLLIILIAATVITAVTMRYVFNNPPLWAEELPRLFLAWMTFLGIALATRRGQNIRVDHYVGQFPPLARRLTETAMHLCVLGFLVVALRYALPVFQLQMRTTALSTGISHAWNYAALPVGCFLALIYQLRLLINVWRREETSAPDHVPEDMVR